MAIWVLLIAAVLGMGACGGEAPSTVAADAGADRLEVSRSSDAAVDADTGPGPTPEEWARCPENIADLGYTVRSCSEITLGFGLSHPRRMMSLEPTWVCDSLDGNRGLTTEECIALMVRADPSIALMARCDLAQFPPPCRCDTCGGQAFRVQACMGYETSGRLYLVEQLNIIAMMVAQTGHCPRLR